MRFNGTVSVVRCSLRRRASSFKDRFNDGSSRTCAQDKVAAASAFPTLAILARPRNWKKLRHSLPICTFRTFPYSDNSVGSSEVAVALLSALVELVAGVSQSMG